ncbi:PH domain-containing protein DDB_G0275795 [Chrysoperla carnea]|uniref:PH domain-containing protein DDB_G0275795 n=1 Tax=Chrysoperla carnea TaxID=189513 RepID=UPI001D0679EA|nr:PH domain-containing protein DDB_G0275795 [Chrysoperla carnea]
MKTSSCGIYLVLALSLTLCTFVQSRPAPEEDYDYKEEQPEPPKPVVPVRSSPLLRRGPSVRAIGKQAPAATSTTTTTTQKPEAAAGDDYEYEDEQEGQETPVVTTTTEAPKKGIRTGVVRPFRSNDDLLAALKRRRQQSSNDKSQIKQQSAPVEQYEDAPVIKKTSQATKANAAGRKRYNNSRPAQPQPEEQEKEETPSDSTPRTARGRFTGRPSSRLQRQIDSESQGSETSQQVAITNPRSYRPRSRQ